MVVCKVSKCPYNTENNICGNPTVGVDENGMCSVIWNKGTPRPVLLTPSDIVDKKEINVIEGEIKNVENDM